MGNKTAERIVVKEQHGADVVGEVHVDHVVAIFSQQLDAQPSYDFLTLTAIALYSCELALVF